MADAAVKEVPREPATVRRFETADLNTHGPWLLKRFQAKFPAFTEREIAGYLSGMVYNNEHLFLYQDNAVMLAQMTFSAGIRPERVVQERFVWVRDRKDQEQLEAAADFYTEIKTWAKRQDAQRIIVCEDSDIPKPLIIARIGRIFDTTICHVRI
jgi:hypothetical protein